MFILILFIIFLSLLILNKFKFALGLEICLCSITIILIILIILFICLAVTSNSDKYAKILEEENISIQQNIKSVMISYASNNNLGHLLNNINDEAYIIILASQSEFKELYEQEEIKNIVQDYKINKKNILQYKKDKASNSNIKWLLYFGN